ncbi:GNAT family N-acetyltransferase [uncultured Tessaracoccus sp.]|uniref:GNAT family N-acetyltransferase n=1 Tax=uncultured Tessaracoccus sp. TaxID=905023 RepID=UPI00260D4121|nr:GNAT family N-acetyltransferase [uncultured Tessaracoccus sp.]
MDWPESQWDELLAVYQRDPAQADYFYLRDVVADEYIGHVHYEISSRGDAEIGINIIPERRRQGWGATALRLLVEQIWAATSVDLIVNEFEETRRSAICLHRKIGFRPAALSEFHGVPMRRWELSRPQP